MKPAFLKECLHWAALIAGVVVLRSTAYGMYEVPTGSMLPTIREGDRIFTNKLAYGLWLPFGTRPVTTWAHPSRGDIVVLKAREGSIPLVKRVVGVAGDVVSFHDGVLEVNGAPYRERRLAERAPEETRYRAGVWEEAGPGTSRRIQRSADGRGFTAHDANTYVVPEGALFCMGDNRDDSHDSRFFGPVAESDVYGRATGVIYSLRPAAGGFVSSPRWDRFFTTL